MKLFLLLSFCRIAVSTNSCSDKTIALNSTWSLPLTTISPSQFCTYKFIVPQDYFSVVTVQTFNTSQGRINVFDSQNDIENYPNSNWVSSLAWPSSFNISVESKKHSTFQIQIDIQLQRAEPGVKISQKFNVGTNLPSTVLYLEDLVEGFTYPISAATQVVLCPAEVIGQNMNNQSGVFNNIFIYDNGQLVGTMLRYLSYNTWISTSNSVWLYVAKRPVIYRGIILATDNSNVADLGSYYVTYVPLFVSGQEGFFEGSSQKPMSALTIVGDKGGATPIDVNYFNIWDNGTFSYISSGPIPYHPKEIIMDPKKVPYHITGSVNTLYLTEGYGSLVFFVSSP